ncbi:MAG: TauD/TfdA dioxygenase family protein [Sphingomonadaceae bacterium]
MARELVQTSYYRVEPLDERFDWGVNLYGLSLADLGDAQVRQALCDLWIQEGVIVFKEIEGQETQLELSRVFGPLREHPSKRTISASSRELIDIMFEPEKGQLNLVKGEMLGQSLPWHSDLIYVDKINHGGILRPIRLPSRMGETGFVDKISAYRELPDDVKEQIRDLHVVYKYNLDIADIKFGPDKGGKVVRYSEMAAEVQASTVNYPHVIHPLVFKQPETGREVLNLSPWFAVAVSELPQSEGDDLLEFLSNHITAHERAYYHDWKMGEMLLWDNWRMLHSATGAPIDEERYLQRTTIGGDYGLGRNAPGGNGGSDLKYLHV